MRARLAEYSAFDGRHAAGDFTTQGASSSSAAAAAGGRAAGNWQVDAATAAALGHPRAFDTNSILGICARRLASEPSVPTASAIAPPPPIQLSYEEPPAPHPTAEDRAGSSRSPLRRAAPQPFSSPSRPSSAARTVRFGPDAIHEDGEEASAGGRIGASDRSDPPGQASQDEKYAYEPPAEQPVPAIEPPERYKPPADLAERVAKAAAAIDAAAEGTRAPGRKTAGELQQRLRAELELHASLLSSERELLELQRLHEPTRLAGAPNVETVQQLLGSTAAGSSALGGLSLAEGARLEERSTREKVEELIQLQIDLQREAKAHAAVVSQRLGATAGELAPADDSTRAAAEAAAGSSSAAAPAAASCASAAAAQAAQRRRRGGRH